MLWLLSLLLSELSLTLAKTVDVSLEAPWRPISEGILALETIAKYNSSSYFPLLSTLINERMQPEGCADEVAFLFNAAEKAGFLKHSEVPSARQEYSMGVAIAGIEAQYQMFTDIGEKQDCAVVMWNEGVYSCDRKSLYTPQTTEKHQLPHLLLTDRVIGNGDQWLVIYADLDSEEFPSWHEALLELALSGKASYVLRQRSSTDESHAEDVGVKLAGYGVGFNLKRTDYLVVDDRMSDGDLKLNLDAPNQVPSSKIASLGFAASRKIRELEGDGEAKFDALEDLSFNFPDRAVQLAAEYDNATAEADSKSDPLDAAGINALFIDGVLLKDANNFAFFDAIRKENGILHTLEKYLPEGLNIPALLTSGITHDGEKDTLVKQRYDLSAAGSAIGWINDIEQNLVYESLDDDLSLLAGFKGPFIPLRRNLHSVVVAGELHDKRTLSFLYSLLSQVGQQVPLQVGLVSSSKEWAEAAELGFDARQGFLGSLFSGNSLAEALKSVEDINLDDDNDLTVEPLANAEEFYSRFGIDTATGPVLFINGFPLPIEDWSEAASIIFENDIAYLRELETLESEDSLRDALFATGEPRRNQILDPLEVQYLSWPTTSPIQPFVNPDRNSSGVRHSVLLSSSFSSSHTLDLAESLLQRSTDSNDCDVFIRPLAGIDSRFYGSILDPTYSMFRFSIDLIKAARGHLYEKKSEPRVFNASKKPDFKPEELPEEADSLIIDGRYIQLTSEITPDLLNKLIDQESARVQRIQEQIPEISGLGLAGFTEIAEARTAILEDETPDIFVDSSVSNVTVTLVLDPASSEGQTFVALGKLARQAGLKVKVILSPSKLQELPKRIYQHSFDRHNSVKFTNLSDDTLYSAELVEPSSWVTMAASCDYDLDNVLLNQVKEDELDVVYTLRSLLIEGVASGKSAPGTVLELRSADGDKIADTTVMANLGYFQFQVHTPGIYYVNIPDHKKSFTLDTFTTDSLATGAFDFSGTLLRSLIVDAAPKNIRPIKSNSNKSSYWDSLKSAVGGTGSENQQADVNIFTVASGHLYERFASIMMLSVMKHSKHSVKFWLIENFLSPKFKKFVPELAKEHGFDYEFISFKWPKWLRSQSEKQRQIWGYKMLFLDTLFPQTLSDVIFVDSDQIVRTDFKELLDIDLEGAPYAFTPMGDDREEMEPYRFWKQGFWKENLIDQDFKYHISALYRVNLDTFRKGSVGDIIRQHYQRLSSNPSNLANLDQDLPNSLQQVVPIFSLPQDWLWCETWCSDESLETAKTIDLCNNPLTKEPKLDRARRQIPEWVEYDDAVAALAAKVDSSSAGEAVKTPKSTKTTAGKTEKTKKPSDEPLGDHLNDHLFEDDVDAHDEL